VFLNEKEEVFNTLDSLFVNLDDEINIIVINDASDDKYNYDNKIPKYKNINYIKNRKRLGVAKSREIGVSFCETPYFLFLDAHMRFYNNSWSQIIIKELEKDDRCILCAQTRFLKNKGGIIEEDLTQGISFGAYLNLHDPLHFFELLWLMKQPPSAKDELIIDIPCIIGAGYACSTRYWHHIKGLWGLKSYGLDEAYLSIKIWLEGGRCRLLKNVEIGHIYRKNAPYSIENVSQIYNKILLLYLLTPDNIRKICFSKIRFFFPHLFFESIKYVHEELNYIYDLRIYLMTIFNHNFDYYQKINYKLLYNNHYSTKRKDIDVLAKYIIDNISSVQNYEIEDGKTGILIFLFHYAEYKKDQDILDFSLKHLKLILGAEDVLKNNLEIGWFIEYLYHYKFINSANRNKINLSSYINEYLTSHKSGQIEKNNTLLWILRYVVARSYSDAKEKTDDILFLQIKEIIYKMCNQLVAHSDFDKYVEISIEYLAFYEGKSLSNNKSSIYDILYIFTPNEYELDDFELGLNGLSGIGLSQILEESIL
jgi:glycosyltransferase involved in cell wall biosynthesis